MSHTPGPWGYSAIPWEEGFGASFGHDGKLVAFVYGHESSDEITLLFQDVPETDEEARANFALLKAAPDLLEACRVLVSERDADVKCPVCMEDSGCLLDCPVQLARVAIAKAEGRS